MESFVDIALWVAIIMVLFAALAALAMPIINSLGQPKVLLKGVIGVVVIAVLFLIFYSMADGGVSKQLIERGVTENVSKVVGGLLMTMYAFVIITIIGIIYSEINKALK